MSGSPRTVLVSTPPIQSGSPPGQEPGGVIVNGAAGKTQDWITAADHGDVELYVEWMVGKGSNSGVYLHGLYEVQVFDSHGKPAPKYSDAGGIYHRWINEKGVGGSSPRVNAARPAGEWQSFHIWFRAPRFDDSGKKTANARFLKVLHNGTLVQENVEVDGGTRAHLPIAEAPRNPLMLQGDHGPVAYRAISVAPAGATLMSGWIDISVPLRNGMHHWPGEART